MDKAEKVAYETSLLKYIESNKLPDLIEQYTKQLILNQPEDPIQFLIDYIGGQKQPRLIFITGSIPSKRNEIVDSICNSLNYKQIRFKDETILKSQKSELTNNYVKESVKKVDSHFRGIILNGYPFNFETSIFSQQNGLIPDRIIILNNERNDSENYYKELYKNNADAVELYTKRDEINISEVKQMYAGFYDSFNITTTQKQLIANNIKSILKLKDRRTIPLRSPRVYIVRPSHLKNRTHQLQNQIAQKYGFNAIQTYNLLNKHIELKTHVGQFIYSAFNNQKQVPDDIILALVRTEILNTSSKQKGYILEGFPKNKSQLNSFQTYEINPHFVIILDYEEQEMLNNYKKLKFDDKSGRFLEENGNSKDNTVNIQKWEEKVKQYKEFIEQVQEKFEGKVQKYNLSTETNEKIIQSIDIFLNNPEIYS